jgi:uncharacterized protein (DUF58 family)
MTWRPTRRAFAVATAGVLLLLAASTAQAGWLFVLAAGVFGLVAASMFSRHRLKRAEMARTAPERTRVGDNVRVGLTLTNTSDRPLPLLRIEDHYEAFEPVVVVAERLDGRETAEIETVRSARKRGVFTGGMAIVTSGAPFGMSRTVRSVAVPTEITVVPRWVELTSFPIREPSSTPSEVLHERARTGAGEEYLGVREYRAGDPLRWIHWRSTARAGQLIVREYEEEVASPVDIVVGGADTGTPPDSAFEYVVAAAASIAVYAISTGHPVRLHRPTAEGSSSLGEPSRAEALDWLAGASPLDASLEPVVAAAAARPGHRGTVVIVSTTSGEAGASLKGSVRAAQSAGSRVIVVAAEAESWDPSHPDSAQLLEGIGGGRAWVRWMSRGQELVRCLQG